MIDLNCFICSLKVIWLRSLLFSNNKYSQLVEIICPFITQMYKFGTDYIKTKLNLDINHFGKMLCIVILLCL